MEQTTFAPQEEKEIKNKAKKRIRVKVHGTIYFLICLFFWLIWYFIFKGSKYEDLDAAVLRSCFFVTLTWGICVVAHYLLVYKWNETLLEKEIKQLEKEKERKARKQRKQDKL